MSLRPRNGGKLHNCKELEAAVGVIPTTARERSDDRLAGDNPLDGPDFVPRTARLFFVERKLHHQNASVRPNREDDLCSPSRYGGFSGYAYALDPVFGDRNTDSLGKSQY